MAKMGRARGPSSVLNFMIENTTSSAVKGVPSWKVTPRRSTNRQVSWPSLCQDSARSGTVFPCSSVSVSAP